MADSTLTYIDDEERELIDSIEGAPQLSRPLEPEEERRIRALFTVVARRKPKDTKITMRISADDLLAIKAQASRLGVEYQPVIAETEKELQVVLQRGPLEI